MPVARRVNTGGGGTLHFGSRLLSTSATSRYLTPGYASTIADVEAVDDIPAPRTGTLHNLRVFHNEVGIGGLITYTLLVDDVATSLAVGLLASAEMGANVGVEVPVTAGQRLAIRASKSSLTRSPRNIHATMEIA